MDNRFVLDSLEGTTFDGLPIEEYLEGEQLLQEEDLSDQPGEAMPERENNLLLRLHKWAWRQDENFLTETLAHLLQHLLDHEPEAAVSLVSRLTGGRLNLPAREAKSLEVSTQVFTAEGTPDLKLRTADCLALVEVKSESEVKPDQLRRYLKLLQDSGLESGRTALVLLTRYPVALAEPDPQRLVFVRWYQVAEWLEHEKSRYAFQAVSAYLVDQFLSFLNARNMTMPQVTWELSGGVRALRALTDMLYEAANACGCQPQTFGDRNYMGVYLDKHLDWLGIHYDRPQMLEFSTHKRRVDKNAAERVGLEGIFAWDDGEAHGWHRFLDLESEEAHFFARSKASQMQVLETFLKECLATVRRIQLQDQMATAESVEDSEPGTPASPRS
jgi:hypothetical protein